MTLTTYGLIQVGQIWQDNDWRVKFRQVRVDRIDGKYAFCSVKYIEGGEWKGKTRIAIRRFRPNSTGYRLVK